MKFASIVGAFILLSACVNNTANGPTTQKFVADAFNCQTELGFETVPVSVSTTILADGSATKTVIAGQGVSEGQAAQITTASLQSCNCQAG